MSNRYNVSVNGVDVGSLTSDEYQKLKADVKRNKQLYLSQGLNLIWVLYRMVNFMFILLPLVAFWGIAAIAVLDPQSMKQIASAIQSNPDALGFCIVRALQLLIPITLMVQSVLMVMGFCRFGLDDKFETAINNRLRRKFNVAADGSVTVYSAPDFGTGAEANQSA